jgi:hypothetical protein
MNIFRNSILSSFSAPHSPQQLVRRSFAGEASEAASVASRACHDLRQAGNGRGIYSPAPGKKNICTIIHCLVGFKLKLILITKCKSLGNKSSLRLWTSNVLKLTLLYSSLLVLERRNVSASKVF